MTEDAVNDSFALLNATGVSWAVCFQANVDVSLSQYRLVFHHYKQHQ